MRSVGINPCTGALTFDGSADALDDDRVRRHILDCLGALISTEKFHSSGPNHKSSLFYKAIIEICEAQLQKFDDGFDDDISVDGMTLLFKRNSPPKSTMQFEAENGDWMPALWVGMVEGVGKKMICEMLHTEPVLKAPKKNGDSLEATALHYAAAAQKPNYEAVELLSSPCSMRTRARDGKVPLHWAAQYSRSLSMIQYLIRADPTAIRMADGDGLLPIEYIIHRKPFLEKMNMIKLLVETDSDAIAFSVEGAQRYDCNVLSTLCRNGPSEDFLEIADMLITLNPKAVFLPNDSCERLPLHWVCEHTGEAAFILAKKLIVMHPESIKVQDELGELPAHIAAEGGSLKLLKLILGEYPEAVKLLSRSQRSLMHNAACNRGPDAVEIIRFLANLDPAAAITMDRFGRLPVHYACSTGLSLDTLRVLYELYPQGICEPENEGNLPAHMLLLNDDWKALKANSSPRAEMLRFLLRHYPDSVLVENREVEEIDDFGEDNEGPVEIVRRQNPYKIALKLGMSDYVRRLILRAAPTCDPQELRRLNYAERRMAMFLTYSAITSDPSSTTMVHILRRLMAGHGTDMPLLKHVISFL